MENPYVLVSELLEEINNRRTQDVIRRRFGLAGENPQTLQEIGEQYNITRERVRQIEKNGLDHLTQSKIQLKLKPLEDEIFSYFKDYGDLRREEKAFDDLVCFCIPAGRPAQMQKDDNEYALCRAALNLILTLSRPFERMPEDDQFHPAWTINKNSVKTAKKAVDSAMKFFNKNHEPLKDAELYGIIKKNLPNVSDKAVLSYIDASKQINQNDFGQFGPSEWPEISPRGVRDKAYLILKKEGRPFHFSEVTDLINQQLSSSRQAYVQTVHNELIKDPRFVLIGRGIYALGEWGYEPGTVIDVIFQILKKEGSMQKEEILKKVLAKRLIKENTILINLQNKKYFKKLEDGRFAVA
ncbi:MAG: hypothetical protein A2Y98_02655 [Candidatus Portnoybacteria bacterium RBG_19FT_COMBO_36_7]|uniref:HTH HARE-type domain-containing protein n=1 Tax=Candidatus Portnoybacteria bacterium RBG_19FT_COMBO_36_7 TaxID=1801992 RepID=A0A1G2F848_9BACT|nr:MAG: hypothetical protein A2Y98_02655 [Candidatus Portnoybacteria bacterium RBG_19FT_COMBO_36_7]